MTRHPSARMPGTLLALCSLLPAAARVGHSTEGRAAVPAPPALTHTAADRDSTLRIALFDFSFYGRHANSIEPGDSALAGVTTAALRQYLSHVPTLVQIDTAVLAHAAAEPNAQDSASGHSCNVIIACARTAARLASADWAITGTLSKTSNLIWLFSGQLINTKTGALVLDDEYELKGNSRDMAVQGARVFSQRVAKKLGLGAPVASRNDWQVKRGR